MKFIQAEPTPELEKWAKKSIKLNKEIIEELNVKVAILQKENVMLQEFLDICNPSLKKLI